VERLSDRVQYWMTLNEPQCFLQLGYVEGTHAPGDRLNWPEVLRAAHHALLAHGKGVQTIRAKAKKAPKIGFAPVGITCMPATDSPEDIEAARLAMFAIYERHLWNNTWFADPAILGHYPEDGLAFYGKAVPSFPTSDLEIIRQPLDFYGMNTYRGHFVRMGASGVPEEQALPEGYPQTSYNWQITPECLYWGPRFFWERYHLPIVVTENGLANADWVAEDGGVHDPQRIDYTSRHLRQLKRAVEDGVPVQGYFHWAIMDNFEWSEGFRQRFGLIHVDYPSGKRIPKDSAHWYKRVIEMNGEEL
jgi:beta-glucosidase